MWLIPVQQTHVVQTCGDPLGWLGIYKSIKRRDKWRFLHSWHFGFSGCLVCSCKFRGIYCHNGLFFFIPWFKINDVICHIKFRDHISRFLQFVSKIFYAWFVVSNNEMQFIRQITKDGWSIFAQVNLAIFSSWNDISPTWGKAVI